MKQKRSVRLGLVAGLLALAFAALPALAGAAQVTDEGGNPLEVGSTLEASSGNTTTKLGANTLSCSNVTIRGGLETNSGGTVLVKGSGEDEASGCLLNGSIPVSVTVQFTGLHLSAATKTATFDFTVHLPGGLSCTYASTSTVSYTAPSSVVGIAGTVTSSSPGCTTSGTISGEFTAVEALFD